MIVSYQPSSNNQFTIELPGSKSITNRLYILEFLLKKQLNIIRPSIAFDSTHLKKLISNNEGNVWDVGPTGTSFRFLAAALSIIPGKHFLTGDERIRERPIAPLIDAIAGLGIRTEYPEKKNYAPIIIYGDKWNTSVVEIDASLSGQFVSALMLAAPFQYENFEIKFKNKQVSSKSYILLTANILKEFGINTDITHDSLRLSGKIKIPDTVQVESDWSSAAFWMQFSLLAKKNVLLQHLRFTRLQGEEKATACFNLMGLTTIETKDGILLSSKSESSDIDSVIQFDFSDCPDAFPACFLTACLLNYPVEFTGLHTLNYKESARLDILLDAAKSLQIEFRYENERLITFKKQKPFSGNLEIDAKNDHRLIMAACIAAVSLKNVTVFNEKGVEKSYPTFFNQIKDVGFQLIKL